MTIKQKRFLGNSNSSELHDTSNEKASCQLSEIKLEHRYWYDSAAEAKRDRSYDNCHWCIGNSTS